MIYVSRSQHSDRLRCPRLGWWGYDAPTPTPGVYGYQRKVNDAALLGGTCIHAGLAALCLGFDVEQAVIVGLGSFDTTVAERGLDGDQPETRALIEALIRAWARVRLPYWRETYGVLDVEREESVRLLTGDVTLLARPDAVVRRRVDGALFIVNWKTAASCDKQWYDGWTVDMQLATETLAVEDRLKTKLSGVIVEGLVKGEKRRIFDENDELVGYELQTPLIYGYKVAGNPPISYDQYFYAKYYSCKDAHVAHGKVKTWNCPGGKKHRRDDAVRFKVWEEAFFLDQGQQHANVERGRSLGPIDYWINWLPEEVVQAQFAVVPPIMRSPEEIRRKALQIAAYEEHAAERAALCRKYPDELDWYFVQNERSCLWPRKCPMYDLCWTPGVQDDPLGSGLYVVREANHPIPSEVEV